jgi:hypothetical protein
MSRIHAPFPKTSSDGWRFDNLRFKGPIRVNLQSPDHLAALRRAADLSTVSASERAVGYAMLLSMISLAMAGIGFLVS